MGKRILLVEDNPEFRRVFTRGLGLALAARAVEAGAQGAQSKAVSIPETAEAVKRLTGQQEG
jgi:CheY-like chemotaxis protein